MRQPGWTQRSLHRRAFTKFVKGLRGSQGCLVSWPFFSVWIHTYTNRNTNTCTNTFTFTNAIEFIRTSNYFFHSQLYTTTSTFAYIHTYIHTSIHVHVWVLYLHVYTCYFAFAIVFFLCAATWHQKHKYIFTCKHPCIFLTCVHTKGQTFVDLHANIQTCMHSRTRVRWHKQTCMHAHLSEAMCMGQIDQRIDELVRWHSIRNICLPVSGFSPVDRGHAGEAVIL